MNDKSNPYSGKEKTLQNNQFSEQGLVGLIALLLFLLLFKQQ